MCLDIPRLTNDILRIIRNFIISRMEPMLYLSYSLAKKKKVNIFSGVFLGKFILMIVYSELTLCFY